LPSSENCFNSCNGYAIATNGAFGDFPQAPRCKILLDLHLKALAPLGLQRWLSLAEMKKTSAKYF